MWRAGWVLQQLRGDPRGLFDANIFYPEPLTLTYSDSMLLPGLTAAPMLAAGVHPVTAYNVLLISGFVLSGICGGAAGRAADRIVARGFVAGIVFGFYPYHFEHYSHLELQMMQWMPLALLALHRFLETAAAAPRASPRRCARRRSSTRRCTTRCSSRSTARVSSARLVLTRRPPLRRLLMPAAIAGGAIAMVLAVPLARPTAEATRGARPRRGG